VTRGIGLILALISLAIVGGLMAMQSTTQGPASVAGKHDEARALTAASSVTFLQVTQLLQGDVGQNGTYVGAQLPPGSDVTLAQATATTYCLEATVSGAAVHESGPGGSPAPGPC
jgi:hypothetical protein